MKPSIREQHARLESQAPHALDPAEPLAARRKSTARRVRATGEFKSRMQAGRVRAVLRGNHAAGPAPYGYRRDRERRLVLEPFEAAIVRRIFRLYLQPETSLKTVATELLRRGIKTRRGRAWSRQGLAWILRNRTYVGEVVFGKVSSRGFHVPLIRRAPFARAGEKLAANDRTRGRA